MWDANQNITVNSNDPVPAPPGLPHSRVQFDPYYLHLQYLYFIVYTGTSLVDNDDQVNVQEVYVKENDNAHRFGAA